MIPFTVILIICASLLSVNSQKSPLCDDCRCQGAEIHCNEIFPNLLIYQSENWINKDTNATYDIEKLWIEQSNFRNLSILFVKSNLTYLNLNDNGIQTIGDGVFQNLQSLEELVLTNNRLNKIQPDAFKGIYEAEKYLPLKSLKILRLDYNYIENLDQDVFEHMASTLEELTLSHNPLSVISNSVVKAIASLPRLKVLDLSYTLIKTLPDHFLYAPRNLQTLDLSGNYFENVPVTLGQADNLKILYLNNTSFHNFTNENGFPVMKSLKSLYVCQLPNLTKITNEAFGGLQNLEELYLNYNFELRTIEQYALTTKSSVGETIWPILKKLHLNNNQLSYLDSTFLARWDSLTELNILENPWVCECQNQWMVDELMPIYCRIDKDKCLDMRCAAPVEMEKYTFNDLSEKDYQMRCLDYYGAQPEKDAAILVGILAGVLISITTILFILFAYQRNWFGFCSNGPASYSRRFYSKPSGNDDFF